MRVTDIGKKETDMNEMEKQDFLKFRELDDARWELIPDMESDDVRTVRDAVERVRVLVKDMAEDGDWLCRHPTARKWVNELTHNAEQAVGRMGNEPEWKLLDAVCGKEKE